MIVREVSGGRPSRAEKLAAAQVVDETEPTVSPAGDEGEGSALSQAFQPATICEVDWKMCRVRVFGVINSIPVDGKMLRTLTTINLIEGQSLAVKLGKDWMGNLIVTEVTSWQQGSIALAHQLAMQAEATA